MDTIFIVDDQENIVNILSEILTSHDFRVIGFTNANDCLTRLRDETPDILLTDLRLLPGPQDGLDLIRTIRAQSKDFPIIAVTGYAENYREKLATLEIPILEKPFPRFGKDGKSDFIQIIKDKISSYRTDYSWKQEEKPLIEELCLVQQNLLAVLEKNPEHFYILSPFKFEEIVAELLNKYGFDIEMTGKTWDEGIDFFAIKYDVVRSIYVVQCKRYKRERRVGISEVRELFGVKNDFGSTMALMATTSFYTKPSKIFEEKHKWEIELKDYDDLVRLLKQRPR